MISDFSTPGHTLDISKPGHYKYKTIIVKSGDYRPTFPVNKTRLKEMCCDQGGVIDLILTSNSSCATLFVLGTTQTGTFFSWH